MEDALSEQECTGNADEWSEVDDEAMMDGRNAGRNHQMDEVKAREKERRKLLEQLMRIERVEL